MESSRSSERIEVTGFLNQGQAGYSLEDQMEISGSITAPVAAKVERVGGFLNQGQAGYSLEDQMEISRSTTAPVSDKVERVGRFLNQGPAGYSLEDQMEISGSITAPVADKVERIDGFLSQGQAGYALEEQMQILADKDSPPKSTTGPGSLTSDIQDISDDAWRYNSPFYDDFWIGETSGIAAVTKAPVLHDDAWRFDSPFYDDFLNQGQAGYSLEDQMELKGSSFWSEGQRNRVGHMPIDGEIADQAHVEEFAAAIYLGELGIPSSVKKLNPFVIQETQAYLEFLGLPEGTYVDPAHVEDFAAMVYAEELGISQSDQKANPFIEQETRAYQSFMGITSTRN
ncbi:MAG: hypothetical protein ACE5Q6_12710 [Dehalococcoidia bacterium]